MHKYNLSAHGFAPFLVCRFTYGLVVTLVTHIMSDLTASISVDLCAGTTFDFEIIGVRPKGVCMIARRRSGCLETLRFCAARLSSRTASFCSPPSAPPPAGHTLSWRSSAAVSPPCAAHDAKVASEKGPCDTEGSFASA